MKPVNSRATVAIDFGLLADHPVSHDRIALFNSGLVTADTYRRDLDYFAQTHPEHLRIDLGWGAEWMPWKNELVTIDGGVPSYDFAETDEIAGILNSVDVRPYWSYSYVPAAVRKPGTDWRTMDTDDSGWVELVRAYVVGAKDRGVSIGYHEVYNEPDLRDERTAEPVFYAGDLDDYLQLYRVTAPAIREADPAARIGGPALASVGANARWIKAFLDVVSRESLPLDFLSFHHYGTYGLELALTAVLEALYEYPEFAHVEIHLNEYNSFTIDYPQGGLQDSFLLASAFAQDVERMLAVPRLTRVSWAQFLDSGNDNFSGMVTVDGAAKPLYSAYKFLQDMPIDRRVVEVVGAEGVGAIASADGSRAAAIIFNRSSADVTVTLSTTDAPADAAVRLLDGGQSGDETVELANAELLLSRGATALVTWGPSAAAPASRIVLRTRYDFPRAQATGWADVDEATATVRFGSGSGARDVRIGLDLVAGLEPRFETAVTFADGSPAAGNVTVEVSGATVWFTLSGAPANSFAISKLVRA